MLNSWITVTCIITNQLLYVEDENCILNRSGRRGRGRLLFVCVHVLSAMHGTAEQRAERSGGADDKATSCGGSVPLQQGTRLYYSMKLGDTPVASLNLPLS